MASPASPAESAPADVSPHTASILASITRRKLAHRSHGRWGGVASAADAAAASSSPSSGLPVAAPASTADRERVWSRHDMASRFPAFVAQSFAQFGQEAPAAEAYEDAQTFLDRHAAATVTAAASSIATAAPSSVPQLAAVPRIRAASCSPALFKSHFDAAGIPVIFDRGLMVQSAEGGADGAGAGPPGQQSPQRPWNMSSWTLDSISDPTFKYADVKFKVDEQTSDAVHDDEVEDEDGEQRSVDDDVPADQSGSFKLPLHEFMVYARHNRDDVPLYIFDAVFDCDPVGRELLSDFTPAPHFTPDLFAPLGEVRRPPYRWLLVGPARSGSALHQDPLATSAWNTCIDGVKRWVLFPPHIAREEIKGARVIDQSTFPLPPDATAPASASSASSPVTAGTLASASPMSADDLDDASEAVYYFTHSLAVIRRDWAALHSDSSASATAAAADPGPHGMLELLQYPGETIFVPSGWWHAVINLSATLAVTQNFVSGANFARSWQMTRKQRPHMARRWAEQIRHRFNTQAQRQGQAYDADSEHEQLESIVADITESDLAELVRLTEGPRPARPDGSPGLPPRSPRRPAGSSEDPAVREDPESWMWNNSSSEDDDDEDDAGGDKQDRSYQ